MFFGTRNEARGRGETRGVIYIAHSLCSHRVYGAEWDTYIRGISPLWQPLTYFLPFVLPYNGSENIINYTRKSKEPWGGAREGEKKRETELCGGGGCCCWGRKKNESKEFYLTSFFFFIKTILVASFILFVIMYNNPTTFSFVLRINIFLFYFLEYTWTNIVGCNLFAWNNICAHDFSHLFNLMTCLFLITITWFVFKLFVLSMGTSSKAKDNKGF